MTSLYGSGGIGKSLLAQLLGTAASLGRYWLGIETERCRVLALFCEDDGPELWRRQERINATLGVEMNDLVDFLPDARAGAENVLSHGQGILQTTELFEHLATAIGELKPGLVILDNIAQMFAGNENDRAHVTQFVNHLARLARDGDCAVVLLGHVAKSEGSEFSGSTAWDAAVRSRLLLTYEGQGDDKRLCSASRRPTTRRPTRSSWNGATACCTPSTSSTTHRPASSSAGCATGRPTKSSSTHWTRCAPAAWPPARASRRRRHTRPS